MLTSLDAIDWAALGSATVSAADVPALLPAVDELVNAVYHQETVWECTEPAVPFLAGLTLTPSVSHRASLLHLLASLSRSVVAGAVSEHVPRLSDLLFRIQKFEKLPGTWFELTTSMPSALCRC